MSKKREKASEAEFLKWFYANCDFGPADGDVRSSLKAWFEQETGKDVPPGYEDER